MEELERAFELVRDMQPGEFIDRDDKEYIEWQVKLSMLALGLKLEQVKQLKRIADVLENGRVYVVTIS